MRLLFGLAAALLCLATPVGAADAPPYGFGPRGTARELAVEQTFLTVPSEAGAAASTAALDSYARFDGTWGDGESARWMAAQLASFGWQTRLAPFQAPLESPKRLEIELLSPHRERFDLREGTGSGDPADIRPAAGIPFNYGSPDGDVRGPLVYANRGAGPDYAALARAGVSVKGAIVVVRDGGGYQGDLAQRAQRAGAAAVIFYPDPADDGSGRGPTFPAGPWRPLDSTERGAVTTRHPLTIPTLPVTPRVAAALLAAVPGRAAPRAWRGALPVRYRMGRGGRARLVVQLKRHEGRLVNVIATLPGRRADVAIVLGAHRDAWGYGAAEDGSGIVTLLETARGLGYLYGAGWRPERTIVIVGFDGAEIGETGSYAFAFAHQLQARVAAYLDCDTCVTGSRFEADGAGPLAGLLTSVSRGVPDAAGNALAQHWSGQVGLPSGGGDAGVFQDLAGVATLDPRFAGAFGVARSVYDDAAWMSAFGDPGYARHRELAQTLGLLALRLADARSLPLRWAAYDAALNEGLRSLSLMVKRGDLPIDLHPLREAVRAFERSAARADAQIAAGAMPDQRQLDAAEALVIRGGSEGPRQAIYGDHGERSLFPAIAKPLAAGDDAAVEWGIERTTASLRRAAATLAPPPRRVRGLPAPGAQTARP